MSEMVPDLLERQPLVQQALRACVASAHLWQSSWWESLPGLLFSPARGLLWFSPVLLLGLVSAAAMWRDPRFRALIPSYRSDWEPCS